MTHFLLATLVTRPLDAGLPLAVIVIANVVLIANAIGTAVNGTDKSAGTSLPLQAAIRCSAYAADAHRAGRA
jgi:hypothetical protein